MQNKNVWALVGVVAVVLLIAAVAGNNGASQGLGAAGANATVYCSDSDGGNRYDLQGVTKTYTQNRKGNQSVISSATDSCTDANNLTEYTCAGNTITSSQYSCGTGSVCQSGACIIASGGGTGPDTIPPFDAGIFPANGSTQYVATGMVLPGVLTGASFNDNVGMATVVVYDNGSVIATQACGGTTSCTANTYVNALGSHTIYGVGTDTSGNVATGATSTFTVVQTTCTDMPGLCSSGQGSF